jgi:SAM-dependent methyltransferase
MTFIFQTNRHLLLKLIEKHAHVVKGKTLDVGSGPLPRYRHLFKNSTEYVKMDIFEDPNVDVVGFAENIPFPDGSFDSIVCTETLNDVFEPTKAFAEFNRVLKKGGIALISATNIARTNDSPTEFWRFTRNGLEQLAIRNGFSVETMDQRGAFWSTRAQLMVAYWITRLNAYNRWYSRLFAIFASVYGKFSIWLDTYERGNAKRSFTNGYVMIARKE